MLSSAKEAERSSTAASRCTRVMAGFVGRLPADEEAHVDPQMAFALVNLVQGRVLEYLAERIARLYNVSDASACVRIERQLISIFSEEFFALFRAKVDETPALALQIARRIIGKECVSGAGSPDFQASIDRMYSAIFRKYLKYRHLGALLNIVAGDVRIQRTIIRSLLPEAVPDPDDAARLEKLLADDPEGVCPPLMIPYFHEGRVADLLRDLDSPEWQSRRERLAGQMAHLRGE